MDTGISCVGVNVNLWTNVESPGHRRLRRTPSSSSLSPPSSLLPSSAANVSREMAPNVTAKNLRRFQRQLRGKATSSHSTKQALQHEVCVPINSHKKKYLEEAASCLIGGWFLSLDLLSNEDFYYYLHFECFCGPRKRRRRSHCEKKESTIPSVALLCSIDCLFICSRLLASSWFAWLVYLFVRLAEGKARVHEYETESNSGRSSQARCRTRTQPFSHSTFTATEKATTKDRWGGVPRGQLKPRRHSDSAWQCKCG